MKNIKLPAVIFTIVGITLLMSGCGGNGGGTPGNPMGTSVSASDQLKSVRGRIQGDGDLTGIPVYLVPVDSKTPVSSIRASIGNAPFYSARSDSTGYFEFQDVAFGKYNLIAQKGGSLAGISRNLDINSAVTDLAVQLTPTGEISGSVSVPSGFLISGVTVFLHGTSFSASTDDSGSYKISGVPAGVYSLSAFSSGLMVTSAIPVNVIAAVVNSAPAVALEKDDAFQSPVVSWQGTLPAPPANPLINWGYYNSADRKAYIWTGSAWSVLTQDTAIGLAWQGALASAPANPQTSWAYYDLTQTKAFIWNGSAWQLLAQDAASYDKTPPVISNITVTFPSTGTALITWTTNEDATAQVRYGPVPFLGQISNFVNLYNDDHEVYLYNLNSGATYFYSVESRDIAQNNASSSVFSFTQNSTPALPTLNGVAANSPVNPSFTGSAFSDAAGQTHIQTDWKVYEGTVTSDQFLVWSSVANKTALTSIVVDDKNGTFEGNLLYKGSLFNTATYTTQVRYYDNYMAPSQWASFTFVTRPPNTLVFSRIYGGTANESQADDSNKVLTTSDGGFIIVATTFSDDYDVSGNHYFNAAPTQDIWVRKCDRDGNIQWQKCYGGDGVEFATGIRETLDGGFAICGSTNSSGNGDIPGLNNGGYDFWILKIDPFGNLLWSKNLGGNLNEFSHDISICDDGGYIVVGETVSSGTGAVSIGYGGSDLWVVKLNSSGNLEWQRTYGGSDSDIGTGIEKTSDGYFVFSGYSRSSDFDLTGARVRVDMDAWFVKFDSTGSILASSTLGGANGQDYPLGGIRENPDGSFIFSGRTDSNDIPGTTYQGGAGDLYVGKLDSNLQPVWQKLFGGSFSDQGLDGKAAHDGGFIIAGATSSNDKDVSGNHAVNTLDIWLLKLDSSGNMMWQKCIGGTSDDVGCSVKELDEGGFVVSGYSNSPLSGDIVKPNHGGTDLVLFKLAP